MAAVGYNSFSLSAGADVDINLTIQDSDGTAVDLTSAAVRFVATLPNSGAVVLDSTASPQTATVTITNAAGGLATVRLAEADTAGLLGDYYYEVKVTDSLGDASVTNRGVITFEKTVT